MNVNQAARRPLPHGYDNAEAPTFLPRPLRSYYRTVTAATDDFDTVLDAVGAWLDADNPGRIPIDPND